MVTKKITVKSEKGIHLKEAALLCEEALKYQSLITFSYQNTTANTKSILSILAARVEYNGEIELVAVGEDEADAVTGISNLLEKGLM